MTTTPTNAPTEAAAVAADAEVKPTKPVRAKTSAMIASIADAGQKTAPAPFGHALVTVAEQNPKIVGLSADLAKYTDMHIFRDRFPRTVLPGRDGRAAAARRRRRDGRDRADPVRVDLLGVRRPPRVRLPLPGHRRTQPQRQRRRRTTRPDHRIRTQPPGQRGHRDLPRHAQPDHRRPLRLRRHRTGRPATRRRRGTVLPAAAPRERPDRAGRIRLHLRTGQGQSAPRRQRRRLHLQRPDDHARTRRSESPGKRTTSTSQSCTPPPSNPSTPPPSSPS